MATASFHTGARPGKRAQPHRNSSSGGKAPHGDIKCAFCDGGHRSNDCTTYSDADSRMKVVKDKRLCFNCLGKHPVAKCSSSNRCLKCRRKHHTTICNSRPAGNQPASLPTSSETAVLHSNTTLPDKEVLLKTAIATVTSQSHVQTTANILFDEGAQKSFITEQLATQLNLKKETTETIYLSSFGSTTNKLQQVDVATVHVVTDDRQTIPVRVLIVPTISTPINNKLQHAVSKEVQVGKDQEKAQSEKDSHSKNRGGKKPNLQSGTYTMKHIVSRMSSYFPNRWPLSYLNLTKNMKTYIRRQQFICMDSLT